MTSTMRVPQSGNAEQAFFTNLLLLGFHPTEAQAVHRTTFHSGMFSIPNKKAFDVVMHFIFTKLDPEKAAEEFRICWPSTDKKQEQEFRKAIYNWLTEITQNESDADFPKVNASLLMSPHGWKVYDFLLAFTTFVLLKIMKKKNILKKAPIRHPVLNSRNICMFGPMMTTQQTAACLHKSEYLENRQHLSILHENWKDFIREQLAELKTNKATVLEAEENLKTALDAVNIPTSQTGSGKKADYTAVYETVVSEQLSKREELVSKVSAHWKQFENACERIRSNKEVMESILSGNVNKYVLDGMNVNAKVPEVLLQQTKEEICQRNVTNINEHGKLNPLSLLHICNLALKIYVEKMKCQGALPNFWEVGNVVAQQIPLHRGYITDVMQIRDQLAEAVIPSIKNNVAHVRQDLERRPDYVTKTSRGDGNIFGLVPPSPEQVFQPSPGCAKKTPLFDKNVFPNTVSTPDEAADLIYSLDEKRKTGKTEKIRKHVKSPAVNTPYAHVTTSGNNKRLTRKQFVNLKSELVPPNIQQPAFSPILKDDTVKSFVKKKSDLLHSEGTPASSDKWTAGIQRVENYLINEPAVSSALLQMKSPSSKCQTEMSQRVQENLLNEIVSAVTGESGAIKNDSSSANSSSRTSPIDINLEDPLGALSMDPFAKKEKLAYSPEEVSESTVPQLTLAGVHSMHGEHDDAKTFSWEKRCLVVQDFGSGQISLNEQTSRENEGQFQPNLDHLAVTSQAKDLMSSRTLAELLSFNSPRPGRDANTDVPESLDFVVPETEPIHSPDRLSSPSSSDLLTGQVTPESLVGTSPEEQNKPSPLQHQVQYLGFHQRDGYCSPEMQTKASDSGSPILNLKNAFGSLDQSLLSAKTTSADSVLPVSNVLTNVQSSSTDALVSFSKDNANVLRRPNRTTGMPVDAAGIIQFGEEFEDLVESYKQIKLQASQIARTSQTVENEDTSPVSTHLSPSMANLLDLEDMSPTDSHLTTSTSSSKNWLHLEEVSLTDSHLMSPTKKWPHLGSFDKTSQGESEGDGDLFKNLLDTSVGDLLGENVELVPPSPSLSSADRHPSGISSSSDVQSFSLLEF